MKKRILLFTLLFLFFFLGMGKMEGKANEVLAPNTEVNLGEVKWDSDGTKTFEMTVDKSGYQNFHFENRKYDFYLEIKIMDKDYNVLIDKSISESRVFGKYYFKKGEKIFVKLKSSNELEHSFFIFETVADKEVEQETNDTKATAQTISGRVMGNRLNDNDVDYFKYSVKNTGYLLLGLEYLEKVYELRIDLINEKDKMIWSKKFNFPTGEAVMIPVKKGDYVIKVSFLSYNQGLHQDYRFNIQNIKSTKYETEFNDESTYANSFGKIAEIGTEEDTDYFKTKIKRTGNYQISIDLVNFYVYHESGSYSDSWDRGCKAYVGGKEYFFDNGELILKLNKGDEVYVKVDNLAQGIKYKVTCKKTKKKGK